MSPKEYDALVVGSGEGAKYLAWTLARQGERVAVIERNYLAGRAPISRASHVQTIRKVPVKVAGCLPSGQTNKNFEITVP